MPRPRSDIWQYFTIIDVDGKSRKTSCNFCGHEQACGATRLHLHLLHKCTEIPHELRQHLRQRLTTRGRFGALPLQPRDTIRQIVRNRTTPVTASANASRAASAGNMGRTTDLDRALSTLAAQGITHLDTRSSTSSATSTSSVTTSTTAPAASTHSLARASASDANDNRSFRISSGAAHPPPAPESSTGSVRGTTSNLSHLQQQSTQAQLDWHLARALYASNVPLTAVDNPLMIDFLKRMRPGYDVPHSQKLQQCLLKEQHWDLVSWPDGTPSSPPPASNSSTVQPTLSQPSTAVSPPNTTSGSRQPGGNEMGSAPRNASFSNAPQPNTTPNPRAMHHSDMEGSL